MQGVDSAQRNQQIKRTLLFHVVLFLAATGLAGCFEFRGTSTVDDGYKPGLNPALQTPHVSRVTSPATDGLFGPGEDIEIEVVFDRAVIVTGVPQLTLETGTTDAVVDYREGNGTTMLTFLYTTGSGQSASRLDYVSPSALALNGGAIRGAGDFDADLTLPVPGASGSLSEQRNLVIDGLLPAVTSVTSSTTNGTHGADLSVTVQVVFNKFVTVTGAPTLTLETGATDAVATYLSGSGTSTLSFLYAISAGESSLDLDYVATTSLALNGGAILDAFSNVADRTLPVPGAAGSLAANKAIVIDTTQPTVTSVSSTTANGTYGVGQAVSIQIAFSRAITVTGTPQLTLETGATDAVVNYASGSGTTTLTFTYTVASGETSLDLDYVATTSLTLNGGTLKDAFNNAAVLTLAAPGAAGSLGAIKALVIDTAAPTVTGVSSSTANGTYGTGQSVSVEVTFSKTVVVTGTPQLTLETGTTDAVASYTSGGGSAVLVFSYTVGSGQSSVDLDYVATTSLALNGGTIKDGFNNSAVLTLASPGAAGSLGETKAIVIDTTVPTVTAVTSSLANGIYGVGQVVPIQITFSKAVTVTGTPRLTLETGATDAVVNYTSGSGTATLSFDYTVATGQTASDLDYTSTTALVLNGGTVKDVFNNPATLTLPAPAAAGSFGANKNLVIDGLAPTVTSVTSLTDDGLYGLGQLITIRVTFSEPVTVTGTPQLTLETGATDAVVDYSSGSGTTVLVFAYTVGVGQVSADLDYASAAALTLNGGTIADATPNAAVLTLPAPGAAGSLGMAKDLVVDSVNPLITSITSAKPNGTYGVGTVIGIAVAFNRAVSVTGTPQLTLETGASDAVVNYTSGSGTATLFFNYTVAAGHASADLQYLSVSALALNGGTIKDVGTLNARLNLPALASPSSLAGSKAIVIDTSAPLVSTVNSATADGIYVHDDIIAVEVTFNRAVTVTGTPQLTLETGATDAVVNYATGSGTATLVFNYTVASGENSADLDYVGVGSLALNGGTIVDGLGNAASLALPAPGALNSLGATRAFVVDTISPVTRDVTALVASGTYGVGDTLGIQLLFNRPVTVTGTPQLTLETGATDAVVNYVSGSGTDTLLFNYTVASGQNSVRLDYPTKTSLALNGGTIKDATTLNALLVLPAPASLSSLSGNKAIVIDTTSPLVASVNASSADGLYTTSDSITVEVNFDEPVDVTGTPQLTLETGATDAVAIYVSGSGTPTLTFSYTVAAGNVSADLDYVATTSLALNGGTIKDGARNAANLTLPAPGATGSLGANKAIVVETIRPLVVNVSSSLADGPYGAGQVVPVQITFNRAVNVTGNPRVLLETGNTDGYATYASGTGTAVLVFNYTSVSPHFAADLDYVQPGVIDLNGGTIQDLSALAAVLTLPPLGATSLAGNKDLLIDAVSPAVTNVTTDVSVMDGIYGSGAFAITVQFDEVVLVTGTPRLTLETGATDAVVDYSSGSGTDTLVFSYTIAPGQNSPDLDYVATTSLALNGGTIRDLLANNSVLTLPAPGATGSLGANKAVVIDTIHPLVTSVTSSVANGTYGNGAVVPVQVVFNRVVNVTGVPQLTLSLLPAPRAIDYSSGTGTNTLVFNYTVLAGDAAADLDYVDGSSLAFNGGTIQDGSAVAAVLSLWPVGISGSLSAAKNLVIDTSVASVVAVSSPAINGAYGAGSAFSLEVQFSDVVTVTGTPTLTLETGATDAVVNYTSGSGTATLTFQYVVASGDNSADLDYASVSALFLNGGTIIGASGNAASLTLPVPGGVGSLSQAKDIFVDTAHAVVDQVSSVKADGIYTVGESISIDVQFNRVVNVTGVPQLTLETGASDTLASYASGSGTNTLSFTYVVQAGNGTIDLEAVTTNPLVFNGGTIQDGGLANANLMIPIPEDPRSLSTLKSLAIDTTSPLIASVDSTLADGIYSVGEVIPISVNFNEPVNVTGVPRLTLETGATDAVVNYVSGSGTAALLFTYTIASPQNTVRLDYVATTSLALNAGTISDVPGNTAVLTLPVPGSPGSLGVGRAFVVDTVNPVVTQVTSADPDATYGVAQVIGVQVRFNRAVNVTGTPRLLLETGLADVFVNYSSGSGTTTLLFNYTVAAGHTSSDLEYFALNSLSLNGGTIRDAGLLNAQLTLPALASPRSLGGSKDLVVSGRRVGKKLAGKFKSGGAAKSGKVTKGGVGSGSVSPSPSPLTVTGAKGASQFGVAISGLKDLNGDGVGDFIVGEPSEKGRGLAHVYNGATGQLLFDLRGSEDGGLFGAAVSGVPDLNGDGVDEIMVGEPSAAGRGRVHVFDGRSGRALYALTGTESRAQFGASLAGVSDVDGDGLGDLFVGEPFASGGGTRRGRAHLLSGASGTAIDRFSGAEDEGGFGISVAEAGDVDDDGRTDFVVGAPFVAGGGTRRGAAYVFRGLDRTLIARISGKADHSNLGYSVVGLGDVDSDGYGDLLLGAPALSGGARAWVFVVSGHDGKTRYGIPGSEEKTGFGEALAQAGDGNADGGMDFLIGEPGWRASRGRVGVHSGIDGKVILEARGQSADSRFGTSVGAIAGGRSGRTFFLVGETLETAKGRQGLVRRFPAPLQPKSHAGLQAKRVVVPELEGGR